MIVAAHQTMLAPPALPYDAEVEWISSNGSQWIDTGVIPTFPDDLTYSAGIMWPNVTTRNIMGRQGSFYVGCVNGGFQPGFGSNDVVSGLTISANTKYDIVVRFCPTSPGATDTVYYKIGATEGSRISWFQNLPENGPVWIFVANNATTLRGASRVYYFQISRNGTTLRDYIPVRVGSGAGAVGYLYDRVSGELFGNAGTGAFVIGPDK